MLQTSLTHCSVRSKPLLWSAHFQLLMMSMLRTCLLSCSFQLTPLPPLLTVLNFFLPGLCSLAETYTCLAAGVKKWEGTEKLKDIPCYEHMAQWNTGLPCLPCWYYSCIWVFLSGTQCASQFMPGQHATFLRQPKTPVFSQKPGCPASAHRAL